MGRMPPGQLRPVRVGCYVSADRVLMTRALFHTPGEKQRRPNLWLTPEHEASVPGAVTQSVLFCPDVQARDASLEWAV